MNNPEVVKLTVVITVVSGREAVYRNLAALTPQVDFDKTEVLVPYDRFSSDVGTLKTEFPKVNFCFIKDDGPSLDPKSSADEHRLFDKRRAVGLQHSRGRIVAMTEDHALPADDWIKQIMTVHEQPYEVIGGAVENRIDKPLNRALYYCDFGRYGRPFQSAEAAYISDVNVAYKREALMAIGEVWEDAYHETTVHWAMKSRGATLYLDERPVVYQAREGVTFIGALSERIGWGRIFAETRVNEIGLGRRILFVMFSLFLPILMFGRVARHMIRQRRSLGVMLTTLPVVALLLIAWSWGEFVGYTAGGLKTSGLSEVQLQS